MAGELAQRYGRRRLARFEARRGRKLQRDAGEVARDLRAAQASFATGGIEDDRAFRMHLHQHHEVVEVPVQDAGQGEFREVLHLESQRARAPTQLLRDAHQVVQSRAL